MRRDVRIVLKVYGIHGLWGGFPLVISSRVQDFLGICETAESESVLGILVAKEKTKQEG